jgi:hypothetical protein
MTRQCKLIVEYMRTYKEITSLEAFVNLGVSRLSARIWDLRHEHGLKIGAHPRKVRNINGGFTTVTAYYLED